MPTMMRNAKKTGTTGGRSLRRHALQAGKQAVRACVRISEAPRGIEIAKRFVSFFSSGQAKRTRSPGFEPSQCASMAAILIG